MAPKLYVFHGSPAVAAVLITADALGLTLEVKELDFTTKEHLSPEFLRLNPQHTVPTLQDEDGFAIWDSHAINAYLVGKYGKDDSLYPKDLRKRAVVDQRLHFESGSLYPLLRTVDLLYMNGEIKEVPPHMIKEIKASYDFLETFLEARLWTAGDSVTIADFNIISTVSCLDYHVKVDPKVYPNITAWRKRAVALPCLSSLAVSMKHFTGFMDSLRK